MSVSCSDCFSDLFCNEDSNILAEDLPILELSSETEESESFVELVKEERLFSPGSDYSARFRSSSLDASARKESIAWIRKVNDFYNFQPITAYLSVNYMDRFLSSCYLPKANDWPLQLLSVACLSLAAKMEETVLPSLVDLQVENARFIFEPQTVRRMELLILTTLDWRLRSITPFNFLYFFAYKVDTSGNFIRLLISRATQIILDCIRDVDFLDHWPSTVAIASILCAAEEIPNLSLMDPTNAVTWCVGLSEEKIMSCFQLMQQTVVDTAYGKLPNIIPMVRVKSPTAIFARVDHLFLSSSPIKKKRRLNNSSWVEDDNKDIDCNQEDVEK